MCYTLAQAHIYPSGHKQCRRMIYFPVKCRPSGPYCATTGPPIQEEYIWNMPPTRDILISQKFAPAWFLEQMSDSFFNEQLVGKYDYRKPQGSHSQPQTPTSGPPPPPPASGPAPSAPPNFQANQEHMFMGRDREIHPQQRQEYIPEQSRGPVPLPVPPPMIQPQPYPQPQPHPQQMQGAQPDDERRFRESQTRERLDQELEFQRQYQERQRQEMWEREQSQRSKQQGPVPQTGPVPQQQEWQHQESWEHERLQRFQQRGSTPQIGPFPQDRACGTVQNESQFHPQAQESAPEMYIYRGQGLPQGYMSGALPSERRASQPGPQQYREFPSDNDARPSNSRPSSIYTDPRSEMPPRFGPEQGYPTPPPGFGSRDDRPVNTRPQPVTTEDDPNYKRRLGDWIIQEEWSRTPHGGYNPDIPCKPAIVYRPEDFKQRQFADPPIPLTPMSGRDRQEYDQYMASQRRTPSEGYRSEGYERPAYTANPNHPIPNVIPTSPGTPLSERMYDPLPPKRVGIDPNVREVRREPERDRQDWADGDRERSDGRGREPPRRSSSDQYERPRRSAPPTPRAGDDPLYGPLHAAPSRESWSSYQDVGPENLHQDGYREERERRPYSQHPDKSGFSTERERRPYNRQGGNDAGR